MLKTGNRVLALVVRADAGGAHGRLLRGRSLGGVAAVARPVVGVEGLRLLHPGAQFGLLELKHGEHLRVRRRGAKQRDDGGDLVESLADAGEGGGDEPAVIHRSAELMQFIRHGLEALAVGADGLVPLLEGAHRCLQVVDAGIAVVLEQALELAPDDEGGGAVLGEEAEQLR